MTPTWLMDGPFGRGEIVHESGGATCARCGADLGSFYTRGLSVVVADRGSPKGSWFTTTRSPNCELSAEQPQADRTCA